MQLCKCSTIFLYISLPLFCTTTTWNFQNLLRACLHGVGDPGILGWFLLFSRSRGHKTKETSATRPGPPTPCKQGLSYTFSYVFSFTSFFFFHCRSFSPSIGGPLASLIFSPPLQDFQVVLPTKKCLLCFFVSCSRSLSPFSSLSFAGLPPTFSNSIFQICGHDN